MSNDDLLNNAIKLARMFCIFHKKNEENDVCIYENADKPKPCDISKCPPLQPKKGTIDSFLK